LTSCSDQPKSHLLGSQVLERERIQSAKKVEERLLKFRNYGTRENGKRKKEWIPTMAKSFEISN